MPFSSTERGREQSKDRGEAASSSHIKLDKVLEEVIESVFGGYSFYTGPDAPPPALTSLSTRSAGPAGAFNQVSPSASQITIIFDI
jgi:hypothetical protein